jgi:hypothetical protein
VSLRDSDPDAEGGRPLSFQDEESAAVRRELRGHLLQWTLAFALLFAGVFFCFWWSGSAIRFSASRVAERSLPTWKVTGTVRDAATHQAVPWAAVEDDPAGQPPFYRADADQNGAFELLTLAEPHRLRVTANGYRQQTVQVGRQWFYWWPRGAEVKNINLAPE